jgi:hypothetical protein
MRAAAVAGLAGMLAGLGVGGEPPALAVSPPHTVADGNHQVT